MPDPTTGLPVVGMVGGGQLARMTHQAAIALGLSLRVLAESTADSAALITPNVSVGAAGDLDAVRAFALGCDVLTFDHEHVPQPVITAIERAGVPVHPSSHALRYAQDKADMRSRLGAAGFPMPRWQVVSHGEQAAHFAADCGYPVIVKTITGGYDGKGVWLLGEQDALPEGRFLVEERVDIVREWAVMLGRRPSGETAVYPVVETVQRDGICVEVIADAARQPTEATDLARAIAEELDVTGVLAVEMFERSDGSLLINELAMRPHNSGHWTIEGARTSQFEQHVRAVLDWPLGDVSMIQPVTVMVNLLGAQTPGLPQRLPAALAAVPEAHVHLYGKAERPGRKLGHVTVTGVDRETVRERAALAAARLGGT